MQILIVVCTAGFAVWRVHLHCQITRQFAAIRAAGLPTSPQELDRWCAPVPDGSNAALVLTQAFALLRTFPDKRSNEVTQPRLLDRREKWSAEAHELIVEHVAMNSNALAVARAAFQRTHCRYPVDLSYGLEADLPHLSGLKSLARAAALRTALSVEAGQAEDWTQDVHFMLQLAASLENEPMILSQMVRSAIITMAVQTTERCLNAEVPGEAAQLLAGAFGNAENTNVLRRGLIGDRAAAVAAFRLSLAEANRQAAEAENPSQRSKHPPLAGRPNPFLWVSGLFERDLNFYLRAMETNIALAALPPAESLEPTNVVEQLADIAQRRHYFLSSMILPSMARVISRDAQNRARLHLVQAALAVEQYRATHGRQPETLADLVPRFLPSAPRDPFTGGPLQYRRLEQGFCLYSVGPDGLDNGGHARPVDAKRNDAGHYDLTFTVER